jgi:hypothetical protein
MLRVRKGFADAGTVDGTMIGHVPPMEAELNDERWIVQYTNGRQEAVDRQTLLGSMAGYQPNIQC